MVYKQYILCLLSFEIIRISWYVAAAAMLEEESHDNVYKISYLGGIARFMPGQYNNHKSLFCFKVDLWEKGNWKEELFWLFYRFVLVMVCYLKPDHLPPRLLRQQQSRETDPRNDWAIIVIESPSKNYAILSTAHRLLSLKLPNEYAKFKHTKSHSMKTLFSLKADFTLAKSSNGCQVTP